MELAGQGGVCCMTDVSIIIVGCGYPDHLNNVLQGLRNQTQHPRELIVAVLQQRPFSLPQMPFPVTQMTLSKSPRLFGAARNAAAMAASGKFLVFLDQRCMPYPNLVNDYARAASAFDGLVMGEVVSKPDHIAEADWPYGEFDSPSKDLSLSRSLPMCGLEPRESHLLSSPVNFGISKYNFMSVHGFDEQVGADASEFGDRLNQAKILMARINAGIVYYF